MRFGRRCFGTPLPVVVGVMCGFLWLGSICAKVAEGEQRAVPEPKGAAWPNEWCDPCMAVVLPCSGARGFLPLAGRDAMKSTSPIRLDGCRCRRRVRCFSKRVFSKCIATENTVPVSI